jgi:spermidine synthase
MKQPWWRTLMSFFWEIPIEAISSDEHEILQVFYIQGQYQLVSPNAIYSYGDLYTNFRRAFEQLPISTWPGQKVLVLGLGLGSIPLMLERRFKKNFSYTIVEFDEAVIYLANKYVLHSLNSHIEVIQADALGFVAQCQETFDLICMDIFLDDTIPSQFESVTFLNNLKELLGPEGVLLYNRLALNAEDRKKSQAFFDTSFKTVFPEGRKMDVGRNWMLLNH